MEGADGLKDNDRIKEKEEHLWDSATGNRVLSAIRRQGGLSGASELKRTTVLLRSEDQRNLERVSEMQGGISDVEAIRRSLKLACELLEWTKVEGGEVILQKGRRKERIRFV